MVRINIVVQPAMDQDTLIAEILEKASASIVAWPELVSYFKQRGISTVRLRNTLLKLLNEGRLVEIECRLYAEAGFFEKLLEEPERLKRAVKEKLESLRIQKCGKALHEPDPRVRVSILRARVAVSITQMIT